MTTLNKDELLSKLKDGYSLIFNNIYFLLKESYYNQYDEFTHTWISLKADDENISLDYNSTKENIESLLNDGNICVEKNDKKFVYKYFIDKIKEKRMAKVTDIFNHNKKIKSNINTLVFLMSVMTDKEISDFHKEFMKK